LAKASRRKRLPDVIADSLPFPTEEEERALWLSLHLPGSEALTSPALLSQRERREKKAPSTIFFCFPSLPLGERG
jgi:hypothetical protein